MALVITDNSPSAGYIAWAGLVVTYKEVNYNVNDSNSNKRYIWWDLDNPNDLQESDTMPTMTVDDCIIFSNINGSSRLWGNRKVPSYVVEEFSNGWIPINYTLTRDSADDPTYVLKITGFDVTSIYSAGMKIKFTQNAATVYGIITKIELSGSDTLVTVYCGTDYDVLDTGSYPITSPYFSMVKAPVDFPLDPIKWTEVLSDTTLRSQSSPTANVWYNPGSLLLNIPIGAWFVEWFANVQISTLASTQIPVEATLSTANNSQSDADLTAHALHHIDTGTHTTGLGKRKPITVTAKTPYYLNIRTTTSSITSIAFLNTSGSAIIRAVCAYL